jgi:glyoxylase-like metal-dependent hydrolase (beta-lactamase superfamily II)
VRTVAGDILTWSWFSQPHGYNFNGFLIRDRSGNLAIDPAEPTEQVLGELAEAGVSRILLTNRNHVRAANQVRASTGARTAIHPGDAAYARGQGAELDDELQVGDQIGPLAVIGVPGKSAGEVAFHWPQRRLLIMGDAVIGNPPGRLSLLPEKVLDDPGRLRDSVRQLLSLEFDTLLVGDGECVLHDARERLRELVATFPK